MEHNASASATANLPLLMDIKIPETKQLKRIWNKISMGENGTEPAIQANAEQPRGWSFPTVNDMIATAKKLSELQMANK